VQEFMYANPKYDLTLKRAMNETPQMGCPCWW